MIESQRCQIVLNAKDLAKVRGLDQEKVGCPLEHFCNGSCCMLYPESMTSERERISLDKFSRQSNLKGSEAIGAG